MSTKRCGVCGKRFATRPGLERHRWAEFVSQGTGVSVADAEESLSLFERTGVVRMDPGTGDLILSADPEVVDALKREVQAS